MNNLLKSILEMDKQARQKTQDAQQYRQKVYDEIEQKKSEIINLELKNANSYVEEMRKHTQKQSQQKLEALKSKNEIIYAELEKVYQNNHEKWIDEIYNRVLNKHEF